MRSLPLPNRSTARADLQKAVEKYKYGVELGYDATEAELDQGLALYDGYDSLEGRPNPALLGPTLGEDFKKAIFKAYDFTRRGRLKYVRENLMAGVSYCPICGIAPPRELDHHLPMKPYRALSVYCRNLVPMCHECNQTKSDVQGVDPASQFIHPYFDALGTVQFVRATITLTPSAIVADLSVDATAAIPAQLLARIQNQFERLRLAERFRPEINTLLLNYAGALSFVFESSGAAGVALFLRGQATVNRLATHLNHWRPVLLDALAEHHPFCDGGFQNALPGAAQAAATVPASTAAVAAV